MKKFIIFLLAVLVAFLSLAYFRLFSEQTTYYKSITATDNSVLVLNNFDLGRIRIVTADTDRISIQVEGGSESLIALDYENDGLFTKFGLSEDWSDVTGTIIVPRGILLDVTLSESSVLKLNDPDGQQELAANTSFLIDTDNLNSLGVGSEGELLFDSSGDLTLWDDEQWNVLGEDAANEPLDLNESDPIYCGIGSQAIRDYCCVNENSDANDPPCDGLGHWIFDNVARDCGFICEAVDVGEIELVQSDCSVGGQSERNTCCADQNEGAYQGCLGAWEFNNAAQSCEFDCDTSDSVNEPTGEGEGEGKTESFDDSVSNYCSTLDNEADQNLCCNDTLKNNLSSGPRPGFPDCIGTWHFDGDSGCEFECAERSEMIKILNEIKQNVQNQEE